MNLPEAVKIKVAFKVKDLRQCSAGHFCNLLKDFVYNDFNEVIFKPQQTFEYITPSAIYWVWKNVLVRALSCDFFNLTFF